MLVPARGAGTDVRPGARPRLAACVGRITGARAGLLGDGDRQLAFGPCTTGRPQGARRGAAVRAAAAEQGRSAAPRPCSRVGAARPHRHGRHADPAHAHPTTHEAERRRAQGPVGESSYALNPGPVRSRSGVLAAGQGLDRGGAPAASRPSRSWRPRSVRRRRRLRRGAACAQSARRTGAPRRVHRSAVGLWAVLRRELPREPPPIRRPGRLSRLPYSENLCIKVHSCV